MTTTTTDASGKKKRRLKELLDLSIHESSFVDDGDNPEAYVRLVKRRDESKGAFRTLVEKMGQWVSGGPRTVGEHLVQSRLYELKGAFRSAVFDALEADIEMMPGLIERATADFIRLSKEVAAETSKSAALSSRAKDLLDDTLEALEELERTSKAAGFDEEAFAASMALLAPWPVAPHESSHKQAGASTSSSTEPNRGDDAPPEGTEMATKENNSAAAAPAPAASETSQKAAPQASAAELEATLKSRIDALTERLEATEKRNAETEKRAVEAERAAALLRHEKEATEYVAKARALGIVSDVEDAASILHGAFKRSQEEGERVEKVMRVLAAEAAIGRKALTSSRGVSANVSNASSADSAEGRLESVAKRLRTEKPTLTAEQAYVEALAAHPELYDEMQSPTR